MTRPRLASLAGNDWAKPPASPGALHLRFLRGVTWNVVGALFMQGSVFLSNVAIANIVGQKGFGAVSIIYSALLMVMNVAQIATGVTATKYVAEFRNSDKARAGRIVGLCSILSWTAGAVSTLLVALGTPVATAILGDPALAALLPLGAVFILFSVANGFQVGALAGLEAYDVIARFGIVQGVLHLLICVAGAWTGGVEGAILGIVVSSFVRWALFAFGLSRELRRHGIVVSFRGAAAEWREIYRFVLPGALGLLLYPAVWGTNALLVREPSGLEQMALFAAALNFKTIVLFLPQLFNKVGMAVLTNQKGVGNATDYHRAFRLNVAVCAVGSALAAIPIAILGRWLLALFGEGFEQGHVVLAVLMAGAVIEAVATAVYQPVQSQGRMWLSFFWIVLPRDLTMVVLAFLLIPNFGALGLAFAHADMATVALSVTLALVFTLRLHRL